MMRERTLASGNVATIGEDGVVVDIFDPDERADALAEMAADDASELAYARMLESRAERGSWFGYGD